jgi:putative transposase
MKTVDTIRRQNAIRGFRQIAGKEWMVDQMYQIITQGKQGLDAAVMAMGKMLVEAIMCMEREEISGPDYRPFSPDFSKGGTQPGSVYIGDQKVKVRHPRLSDVHGEVELKTYGKMKEKGAFSEELLGKLLRGMSAQKYGDTVVEAAKAFGVSASSVSRRIVEITAQKLREFKERNLSDFHPFAIFIDTVHRGGEAFVVALGIDMKGEKRALGFWQGATENHDICEELLADMERRGLRLSHKILWITDGGKGVIKALKDRYGKRLIHVRCAIHKSRNIQRHLAKKYRKEAHRRFAIALEQTDYTDAKRMLLEMEKWLRSLNESAADSLLEAIEEVLTLHRLKVPALLRKSLHTTNAIESMFSTVRDCESNIKRYRKGGMTQRWLASVLLHCEKGFNRIKGYAEIAAVVAVIEAEQADSTEQKRAA